ncbi:MAG TPA: DHA2 family efflux MFS transporter permease subunit [Acidimicrobiales bacterium]|nr:DHA2 family efflux MFS transporter permease subunit [Acidimicrobiales bacterium]
MTTYLQERTGAIGPQAGASGRRWAALVCISVAQLMVALDATVINIALPSAQRGLHISVADRSWVVTAYTLAFGGLLLLGGRLADTLGRRRTFLIGLAGFAAASAAGGAAQSFGWLLVARGAQGAFAALLAPTALSLLAITFVEARERAKAFAVFGAIAGTGGALGLLLGGLLTEYVQWRWCLLINVPIALGAFVAGARVLPVVPGRKGARLDVPGALLVTAGLVSVVYGLAEAATRSWSSSTTLAALSLGAILLVGFVAVEATVAEPLLPLRISGERSRGGASVAVGLAVIALYGLFLLLTYEFQVVLGYSPAKAGLAFLPMSAAVMTSSTTISRALLARVAPRMLMVPGLLLGAVGMAILTRLQPDSAYAAYALPAEILLGLGMGAVFVPAFSTATAGVNPQEAGVASAVANTAQQMGASVGTALLNTIAATATATYLAAHVLGSSPRSADLVRAGLVHGYATAAGWAAVVLTAAAVIVGVLVAAPRPAASAAASEGSRDGTEPGFVTATSP